MSAQMYIQLQGENLVDAKIFSNYNIFVHITIFSNFNSYTAG